VGIGKYAVRCNVQSARFFCRPRLEPLMKNLPSVCVAVGLAIIAANPTFAAELKIFGSRVSKMIVDDIGPQFERTTGHHLLVVTDVAAVMKRRIEAGEAFDLAVLVNFQGDDLIK